MIDKIVRSMAEAMAGVKDGFHCPARRLRRGRPAEPVDRGPGFETGITGLVAVANNAGTGHAGLARLIELGRVCRMICNVSPQHRLGGVRGSLSDGQDQAGDRAPGHARRAHARRRRRSGRVLHRRPPSAPKLADGKEVREITRPPLWVLEYALHADIARSRPGRPTVATSLIGISGRNFNPVMATAAALTIVQRAAHREAGRPGPRGDRHARHLRGPGAARALRRPADILRGPPMSAALDTSSR